LEAMAVVPRSTARLLRDGMGIVEAHEPLAVGTMERERIVETMGFPWRWRHARDHETNPTPAGGVDDEDLPIEIDEKVQGMIGLKRLEFWLSEEDNL
jgi:hypothetical protein